MTYNGFSQLEILLVLALVAIISVLAVPITLGQLDLSENNSVINQLGSDIFSQQQKAYSGVAGSNYGIIFDPATNSYILFQGDSFATATDTSTVELPDQLNMTSVVTDDSSNELRFLSGNLKPEYTLAVNVSGNNNIYTISINREGLVDITKN